MRRFLFSFAALMLAFAFALPASAATVSTSKCAAINPTDGETSDWADIPYLVNQEVDRTEGTLYYLDEEASEWTTTEPDSYRYSVNMDQWSKIETMKTCNTAEDFYMTMSGGWPMFSVYDNDLEGYLEIFVVQGLQQQELENPDEQEVENPIMLPEDWNYWMVWKMQKVNNDGDIIYFAANVGVAQDLSEISDGAETQHPQLYLYKESGSTDSFEDASFDANADTLLTTIAVSDSDHGEEDTECQEGDECDFNAEDYLFTDLEDQAFEVKQGITEIFEYAPFGYSDSIQMSVAMYDEATFSSSAQSFGATATSESDPVTFQFSKRGVLNARAVSNSVTTKKVKLRWKKFKTKGKKAKNYEVKVYNDTTGKLVKRYKKVKRNSKVVKGLTSGTTYRAIVRARKKGKFSKKSKRRSAWSSGARFTTE